MHLSLSDLITCPRCGPAHGLVLLPASVRDRRVQSGVLGCANCRDRYGIEAGIADLRLAGSATEAPVGVAPVSADPSSDDAAVRLAALLGLADARGPVLLAGPVSSHAVALSRLLVQAEVVALLGETEARPSGDVASREVTCIVANGIVPFRSGALTAAAITGSATVLVEEALRAVRPTGRVLLEPIREGLEARAAAAGGATVLSEGPTMVLVRRA